MVVDMFIILRTIALLAFTLSIASASEIEDDIKQLAGAEMCLSLIEDKDLAPLYILERDKTSFMSMHDKIISSLSAKYGEDLPKLRHQGLMRSLELTMYIADDFEKKKNALELCRQKSERRQE